MLPTARFVIVIITVAVLATSCHRASPKPNTSAVGIEAISPADDTPTMMRHFAEQAVIDAAQRYRTQLDYSPESVESIERILNTLTHSTEFNRFTDKDIRAEALIFGAYIGEVIRLQHGGEWTEDHPKAGSDSYPLSWNGRDSFPYGWCYKRLTQGSAENVWHKFQYFVTQNLDPSIQVEVIEHEVSK